MDICLRNEQNGTRDLTSHYLQIKSQGCKKHGTRYLWYLGRLQNFRKIGKICELRRKNMVENLQIEVEAVYLMIYSFSTRFKHVLLICLVIFINLFVGRITQ